MSERSPVSGELVLGRTTAHHAIERLAAPSSQTRSKSFSDAVRRMLNLGHVQAV
jgi:hypothetical protein